MVVFSKPSEKTPGKRQLDMMTATFDKKEDAIAYCDKYFNDPAWHDKTGNNVQLVRVDEIQEIVGRA